MHWPATCFDWLHSSGSRQRTPPLEAFADIDLAVAGALLEMLASSRATVSRTTFPTRSIDKCEAEHRPMLPEEEPAGSRGSNGTKCSKTDSTGICSLTILEDDQGDD
jgi:hypothetical protein